jgi:aryl carrier-like protein
MTGTSLTLERLRADIAAMIEVDVQDVGNTDNLIDLGLDSMRAMNLMLQWSDEGVPLDFADLAENMTLDDLWAVVQERQAA